MKRKYGIYMMAFGMFLIGISLVTAQDIHLLAIGDMAHLYPCESLTGEWNSLYNGYADLSLSTDRVQGSYSLQVAVTGYDSYTIGVADGTDWSDQTELHFSTKINIVGNVELKFFLDTYDDVGASVTATYILSIPPVSTWQEYIIDLTSPTSGSVYLNRIHYVTFYYNPKGASPAVQLIDNVYTVYTSASPTPSPTPSPSPSASPSPTPTPEPGTTPAPTTEPNATATPEPTLEPGTTPTPSPPPATDNFNRIGVFSGLGVFCMGAVVTFTGRKRK